MSGLNQRKVGLAYKERWSIHLKNVQINALRFVEVYIEHLGE